MIKCKALDRSFETKEALFEALRKNKNDIISFKKAQVYKSIEKDYNLGITARPISFKVLNEQNKGMSLDDNYYYIATNSTRILDSHNDLHVNGIWNKTVKEQQGKNYLVDTHVMSISTTIARKEHIEMFVAVVPFSAIGKDYEGDTEVLVYKIPKTKIMNPIAKEWLDSGDSIESSVRMQYGDIALAMNSDDQDDKQEKKNYLNYIDSIANKSDFENEIYYFWIIKQAKNIGESSLVLLGSNHATGMIQDKNNKEAVTDTSIKPEADIKSLQSQTIINILNT